MGKKVHHLRSISEDHPVFFIRRIDIIAQLNWFPFVFNDSIISGSNHGEDMEQQADFVSSNLYACRQGDLWKKAIIVGKSFVIAVNSDVNFLCHLLIRRFNCRKLYWIWILFHLVFRILLVYPATCHRVDKIESPLSSRMAALPPPFTLPV